MSADKVKTPSDALLRTPVLDEESPFGTMMSSFDAAARRIGLDEDEYKVLRKADREVAISVPVRMDSGRLEVFDGYRIQHNAGLGPFIGPLRIAPDLRIEELRALAAWMTWKCAILNVPFGGAAGGLRLDPERLQEDELQRAVRRYTANLLGDVGPERDVFTPDLYADERVMAWILDTISYHERATANPAVTGKPTCMSGSATAKDAVARGLHVILRLALAHTGVHRLGASVNVQGLGVVGGALAQILHQNGFKVTGMADISAAVHDPEGLDVPAAMAWRREHGHIAGWRPEAQVDSEEFVTLPCDVFAPCAIANAIHSHNAVEVQAKLVLEGAHGPVSNRGDHILQQRGIQVVPDILANGGAVVSSYFEWVQSRTGLTWIEAVTTKRMSRFMREAWEAVIEVQDEFDCQLREAAQILAVRRISQADQLRGIYA